MSTKLPVFSQIPAAIYRTAESTVKPLKTKKVKSINIPEEKTRLGNPDEPKEETANPSQESKSEFAVPGIIRDYSKVKLKHDTQAKDHEKIETNQKEIPKPDSTTTKKETLDAIVQTDFEKPKLVNQEVQTIESFELIESYYEQYKLRLQSDSMINYRPTLPLKSLTKYNPPLRVGMTLPRGVKRKVFYPDEQD